MYRAESGDHALDEVYNSCLITIEDSVLFLGGLSLTEYGLLQPNISRGILENIQYLRETNYDINVLSATVSNGEASLTNEQRIVYQKILDSIESDSGKLFFLDATGETGKTFLINLLLAKIRMSQGIALAVASSGIAATLLEGGKTAHSAFMLPLNLNNAEIPICNISKQSNIATVLQDSKFIDRDECPMSHKSGFEALNNTLNDIKICQNLMGGVTVLLAETFVKLYQLHREELELMKLKRA